MTDIDTIREALEDAATQTIYPPVWKRAEAALAALERVSGECNRLQNWAAVCRVQFEKANMAADRFQKESMALKKELERVSALNSEMEGEKIVAFVQGAKWWEFHKAEATMWQSDQLLAAIDAERRSKSGTLGRESR